MDRQMDRKAFQFEVKAADDEKGTIEGYLAVFGNVDLDGDMIEPGAFKDTIAEAEKRRKERGTKYLMPLLWQHDVYDPIGGIVEMREEKKGLYIKAEIDLDIPQGQRAYSGLKKGYIRGLSIGYQTEKADYKGDVRVLKRVRLFEGSVVTFPANPEANVERVKTRKGGEAVEDGMEAKGVGGKTDWPLADRDRSWDADAARKRLVEWATDENGNLDAAKMRTVHFWYDGNNPDNVTAYKLPFCDVIDGKVMAVPRAIFTVAAVLQGARGGVDIPEEDKAKVRRKVESYYARMRREFNDDSIRVPWEKAATFAGALAHNDLWSRWQNLFSTLREYILHVLSSSDRDDKLTDIRQGVDQFRDALLQWAEEAIDAGFPLMPDGGIIPAKAVDPMPQEAMELLNEMKAFLKPDGTEKSHALPPEARVLLEEMKSFLGGIKQ